MSKIKNKNLEAKNKFSGVNNYIKYDLQKWDTKPRKE